MSLTLRGATGVHCPFSPSIVCLRRRMILMMNSRCIGKCHLQCVEQQISTTNVTQHCACHATLTHDWSSSHMKRCLQCAQQPRSNTAPVMQNDSYAWSSSHMKRYLQCAEQHVSPSNLTKYCACQAKWLACLLIVLRYETSFTYLQWAEQHVSPPNLTKYCACHAKWLQCLVLVTYETSLTMRGRSSRCHPPISPNSVPAAKNATAKFQRKFPKTGETSFTVRGRSENDPSMIRPWNRQSATRLATEVTFRGHHKL